MHNCDYRSTAWLYSGNCVIRSSVFFTLAFSISILFLFKQKYKDVNNFAMTIMTLHAPIKDLVTLRSMGAIMIHSYFAYILIQLLAVHSKDHFLCTWLNEILCVVSDKTDYFYAFRDAYFAVL